MLNSLPEYNYADLTHEDLINEIGQLDGFIALAKSREVNVNDFNNALLEHEVDRFEADIHAAIGQFIGSVQNRKNQALRELDARNVFSNDNILRFRFPRIILRKFGYNHD